jgi:hypothetical protein
MTGEEKTLLNPKNFFGASKPLREGLEPGTVAVVAARAGVGKSSTLVQIALDELVDGGATLHISLDNPVAHVRRRYNRLIEYATQGVEDARHPHELRLHVEQLRHIHSYLDGNFTPETLVKSSRFVREHMDLRPRLAVIDGFSFADAKDNAISELREAALEAGLEVWLSVLTHRHEAPESDDELPPPLDTFSGSLDAVVRLEPEGKVIDVQRWRKRGGWAPLDVRLDPKTMLLVNA